MADAAVIDDFLLSRREVCDLLKAELARLGEGLRTDIRNELRCINDPVAVSAVATESLPVLQLTAPTRSSPRLRETAWEEPQNDDGESHKWARSMKGHAACKIAKELHSANKVTRQWKNVALDVMLSSRSDGKKWLEGQEENPSNGLEHSLHGADSLDKVRPVDTELAEDDETPAMSRAASQAWGYHAKDNAVSKRKLVARSQSRKAAETTGFRRFMEDVVCSQMFEHFVMVLIVINAIMVGAQTNYMAGEVLDQIPLPYRVYDIFYLCVCIIEVLLRLYVFRLEFLRMWGWQWNAFDMVLVSGQVLEEILSAAVGPKTDGNKGLIASLALLSIVRILRALRVVRVLKVLQHAQDLRLIVSCIAYSIRPLFWSVVVICTMTYIVSLYYTQLVTSVRAQYRNATNIDADSQAHLEALDQLYGSLFKSGLSLIQGITGGHDWDTIVRPVSVMVNPASTALLVLYIGFAILAVMNVVTGLFCESAMERAQEVRQATLVSRIRDVFENLDLDTSGCISLSEFEQHVETSAVQAYFKAMDIAPTEAKCLFETLDCDQSGVIDFEEFMHGCLRLQGSPRAADLLLFSSDVRNAFDTQLKSTRKIEKILLSMMNSRRHHEGKLQNRG
eukprot:TRINITY_DN24317_c0_g2_i1.p1 TRINITY_DN24317_c0_g2~~TRINITY_DN24317_c0_g2_i1.p1  ORF type:complete len:630 (+),score=106.86 TRINITY_DN24317_c0_g2_i1:33-1892(+)